MVSAVLLALALSPVHAAPACEPGLGDLRAGLAAGLLELGRFKALPRPLPPPPGGGVVREQSWSELPAPSAPVLEWLGRRVPGVDAPNVRVVPVDLALGVMERVVTAGGTYIDLFSDPAFRGKALYFTPLETLNEVDRKFIAGSMPIRGQAEDGKPFQLQGLLSGQGRVEFLYDREFQWKENGHKFKIERGARLTATILQPGDVKIEGLFVYGKPIFCPWARVDRMTKESAYKVRIDTSCGSRGGNDLRPVQRRPAAR
jgi:hypothetical protein